jgi:hypothetical protein
MKIQVLADADAVAKAGARIIAEAARSAVTARGRCSLALSGGRTPWLMLRALVEQEVPWQQIEIFQVTSAWRRLTAPIAISRICARASWRAFGCRRTVSIPCRSRRAT